MPTYVSEREIAGADKLSAGELRDIAAKSNQVVDGLGVPYKWLSSYVAGDKIYCVHEADDADTIRRHAHEAGFPANKVTEVAAIIGPTRPTRPDLRHRHGSNRRNAAMAAASLDRHRRSGC